MGYMQHPSGHPYPGQVPPSGGSQVLLGAQGSTTPGPQGVSPPAGQQAPASGPQGPPPGVVPPMAGQTPQRYDYQQSAGQQMVTSTFVFKST